MGKHDKTREKICSGTSDANIPFDDLCAMLDRFGFVLRRGSGSRRIYTRDGVAEILNLQPRGDGKAKPYQVKQVRTVLLNYNIS
jgi:hypothetical protein